MDEDGTDVVPVRNIKAYRGRRDIAPQPIALPSAYRTVTDVHEPPYLWFKPFVIAHFNTRVLTLLDWFQWIRIKSYSRCVSSPFSCYCTFHSSSVKFSLSLGEFAYFHALWTDENLLKTFKGFYAFKKCVLLTINLFCLFSCYFIFLIMLFHKFLKQIGVLKSKWNTVFVIACQFQFHHEHQDSTVFQNVPERQEPELCSWQVTATDGTLHRQFKAENFGATMLKAQNSRICVHQRMLVTNPAKKCK